jgi:hypothetical protein
METTITENALCAELMPILNQLQAEGYDVYTYQNNKNELTSLYWFENGRILNIQSSTWRDARYARDRFNLGVSYIPSREHGSGCGLSDEYETGTPASELLRFRKSPTWVRGITNYKSMQDFLKRETVLKFSKLDANGNLTHEPTN